MNEENLDSVYMFAHINKLKLYFARRNNPWYIAFQLVTIEKKTSDYIYRYTTPIEQKKKFFFIDFLGPIAS